MTIVTPVKYDGTDHMHAPFADGDTVGPENIALSADSGNQLQKRADGLYYGSTAPASVNPLYVSNDGNDTNDGLTAETPLKTLGAALRKQANSGVTATYTIYLHAGHTFAPDSEQVRYGLGSTLVFQFYADPKYGQQTERGTWIPACAADLERPTINFSNYKGSDGLIHPANIVALAILSFRGMNITQEDSVGATSSGEIFFYATNSVVLDGCNFTKNANHTPFATAPTINPRQVEFSGSGAAFFLAADYQPYVFAQTIAAGPTADPYGTYPAITAKSQNTTTYLTTSNICSGGSVDATTKTFFGYSTNWDIFATS